jgi:hypothetical protein
VSVSMLVSVSLRYLFPAPLPVPATAPPPAPPPWSGVCEAFGLTLGDGLADVVVVGVSTSVDGVGAFYFAVDIIVTRYSADGLIRLTSPSGNL